MGSSKDIGSYLILAAIGIVLLVVIYFMARWKPLAGTITFGIGVGIWLFITPPRSSSDPAGAGVEAGLGYIQSVRTLNNLIDQLRQIDQMESVERIGYDVS